MIFFGTKTVDLETRLSPESTCRNCNTKGQLLFKVFRKHFHIMWIPIFPFAKNAVSICAHCKKTTYLEDMPLPQQREFNKIKKKVTAPLWQFAGLFIFISLIIIGRCTSINTEQQMNEYLTNPLKGDVYSYETTDKTYSTLKIVYVSIDSIEFIPNIQSINKKYKTYKIDKEKYYKGERFTLSKERVKEMFKAGTIYKIKR